MSSHGRLFNNRCIISIQHSVNYTKWFHFVKPYAPHAEARKNHGVKVMPLPLALKSLVLSRKSPHVVRTVRFLFFNRPFIRPMTFLSGGKTCLANRRRTGILSHDISGAASAFYVTFTIRILRFPSPSPFLLFVHMFISYHQLVSKPTGVTRLVCKMRENSYGMRFRDIFGSSRT